MKYRGISNLRPDGTVVRKINRAWFNRGEIFVILVFSGNVPLIKGFDLTKERTSYHLLNCQYLRLNVKRVWSKMNIYSNFDYWILEWLVVALCLPSMRLNGLKTYEI